MFLGKLLSLPIDEFDVTGRPEHCLQYRKIQFERRSRIEVVQLAARISVDQGQGSAGLLNWYGAPVTLTSCHASPHGRMNRLRPYFASHPCASSASLSLHNGDGRVKMPDADASVPRARRWCRHWGNIHDRSLATNPARDACDTDSPPCTRSTRLASRAGPRGRSAEDSPDRSPRLAGGAEFRAPAGASRHDPGEGVLREATIARECRPPVGSEGVERARFLATGPPALDCRRDVHRPLLILFDPDRLARRPHCASSNYWRCGSCQCGSISLEYRPEMSPGSRNFASAFRNSISNAGFVAKILAMC